MGAPIIVPTYRQVCLLYTSSFTVNDKSALGLDGIVYFSKNFGNSATVTVYTLSNNPYFDSNYASDDDIKEQIESAFAQLKSTNNLDQIAQEDVYKRQ